MHRIEKNGKNNRVRVDFEVHVLADRCDHSIGKLDLTARSRLIRQNHWHGLARVNQTQRTFRWSEIKRIMISVVVTIDSRSVSFVMSLRYDPSGFRMLSCHFRASVMRLDGSIHPAGKEIPASKLSD